MTDEIAGRPRLGLCCVFRSAPITVRTRQASYLQKYDPDTQLRLLSEIIIGNSRALLDDLKF